MLSLSFNLLSTLAKLAPSLGSIKESIKFVLLSDPIYCESDTISSSKRSLCSFYFFSSSLFASYFSNVLSSMKYSLILILSSSLGSYSKLIFLIIKGLPSWSNVRSPFIILYENASTKFNPFFLFFWSSISLKNSSRFIRKASACCKSW